MLDPLCDLALTTSTNFAGDYAASIHLNIMKDDTLPKSRRFMMVVCTLNLCP